MRLWRRVIEFNAGDFFQLCVLTGVSTALFAVAWIFVAVADPWPWNIALAIGMTAVGALWLAILIGAVRLRRRRRLAAQPAHGPS